MTATAEIVFVACNRNRHRFREDPSFTHRCANMALALGKLGVRSELVHFTSLIRHRRFKVAVFHRPRNLLPLNIIAGWMRLTGTVLIADMDDLVFDEGLARHSPAVLNGRLHLQKIKRQFVSHRLAAARFNRITVSTDPLAEHARQCFPSAQLAVVPNGVPCAWQHLAQPIPAIPAEPVLLYLPGTPSHDRDFERFSPAVGAFLAKHPAARLEITGPLRFSLPAPNGQVVHREKLPFDSYHECFQRGWVNLAPLEPTPFTRCKSALKVMEAAFWGRPTVCSPTPDTERFREAGALPADDAAACLAWLEALLDPDRYEQLCTGLRERVLAAADMVPIAKKFIKFSGLAPPSGKT
jgi:glycosyltransferase involved in cell wall biosynthesis